MLLDRAAALATKINTYQKLKNTADEADLFGTRAKQFESASLLMKGLRETLSALADAGVPVDFEPGDGLGYAEKARMLREAIKEDPAKVNDPPFDIKHAFVDRLNGIVSAGHKAASAAWSAYVDKRAAFGADDVLSALGQVPQFRVSVARIRQIRIDVAAFGAGLPADPKGAITSLDTLVEQHETAWKSLAATDIPPSVVTFIRAAASSDALLTAYTSEVQTWLEGHKLLDAFRIKLR
ncbi:hypothetical protein [Sphingopyxis sp. C-1]|uniref:hypothetical protein n=1 Tax=Sphingopyxis sp. C-1 TaxID=262667 RepID=UPI0006C6D953|nr:hypothetical protein [Sphingopyxis sp. C-1]GAO78136.1 hypothetical protein SC1_01437 [Sphingopyxis sp. C-1]